MVILLRTSALNAQWKRPLALTLCFNGLIQVCDNLYGTVTNETIGYMKVFYSLSFNKKC